ncbi:MAG: riboflavin synthase [Sarcina sp.]
MFTGIIEELGKINSIKVNGKSAKISILASKVLEDTKLGDSIATNGVCLTVTNLDKSSFEADVMTETMNRTNLSTLKTGSSVNLERAMIANGRFGGHIVSGHVDGTGVIENYKKDENATWVTISAGDEILKYVVEKGSICIDGISLTVACVDDRCFKVSIIPHTGEETTLLKNEIGGVVNLECDVIGKYVEKLLGVQKKEKKSNISEDFLRSNGFM